MKKRVVKITFRTRACRRKSEDEVEKREGFKNSDKVQNSNRTQKSAIF